MEQTVKVRDIQSNGQATVVVVRQSACSGDCHKCSGCGAAEETLVFTAANPIGAKPGDVVILESETAPVLRAAAVLYVLPVVLFFAGYLFGMMIQTAALCGGLGFLLGIGAAVLYDRKVQAKMKNEYTITRWKNN